MSEPVTEVKTISPSTKETTDLWNQVVTRCLSQNKSGMTWRKHARGRVGVLVCVQYVYSLLWQTASPQQTDSGAHRGGPPQVKTASRGLEFAYGPASVPEPSSILNIGSGLLKEKEKKFRQFTHFNKKIPILLHGSHIEHRGKHVKCVPNTKSPKSISHLSAGPKN